MKTIGMIGIGDMGSGIAQNLLNAGFNVRGFDLSPDRMAAFAQMGGTSCGSAAEVGDGADLVFLMVMNGDQARAATLGENGLSQTLASGAILVLTATINPREARDLDEDWEHTGWRLIASPVSGGRPGAEGGTRTLMAATTDDTFDDAGPALQAIAGNIHRVGADFGDGQTVKACLQSLIGSIFTGAFEATALAAKAGVPGQVLYDVFSTSAAGCGITKAAIGTVIDRTFEGTGSHINTMHKDLTIALDLAQELGVPLFTAGTAMQLFQAGRTRYPDGDNQSVARISEEIIGTGLHR